MIHAYILICSYGRIIKEGETGLRRDWANTYQVEFCPQISNWISLPFCFTFESSLDFYQSCLSFLFFRVSFPFKSCFFRPRWGGLYAQRGAQPRQEPAGLAIGQPTSALGFDRWERSLERCVAKADGVCGAASSQSEEHNTKGEGQTCIHSVELWFCEEWEWERSGREQRGFSSKP